MKGVKELCMRGSLILFFIFLVPSVLAQTSELLKYINITTVDKTILFDYYVYHKYNIHTINISSENLDIPSNKNAENTSYWILIPNKDVATYLVTGNYTFPTISEKIPGPNGPHFDLVFKGEYYTEKKRFEELINVIRNSGWGLFPAFAKHWIWDKIIEPNWNRSRDMYDLFYYAVDRFEVRDKVKIHDMIVQFVEFEWKKISYCLNNYNGTKLQQCLEDPLSLVPLSTIENWNQLDPNIRYLVLPEKVEWTPNETAQNGEPLLPKDKDKVWIWYKVLDPDHNKVLAQLIVGWYIEDRWAQTSTEYVRKESTYRVYYKYNITIDMDAVLNLKCTESGNCKVFYGWNGTTWAEGTDPESDRKPKNIAIRISNASISCTEKYCNYTVCIETGKDIPQKWELTINITFSLDYQRASCGVGCTLPSVTKTQTIFGWYPRFCYSNQVNFNITCECCNVVHIYQCTECDYERGTCANWEEIGCCQTDAPYGTCGCNTEYCRVCPNPSPSACTEPSCAYPIRLKVEMDVEVHFVPEEIDTSWSGHYNMSDRTHVETIVLNPEYRKGDKEDYKEWNCYIKANCTAQPQTETDTWPDGSIDHTSKTASSCGIYRYVVIPVELRWTASGDKAWTAYFGSREDKMPQTPDYWEGTAYVIFKVEIGTTGDPSTDCDVITNQAPPGWTYLNVAASSALPGWVLQDSIRVQPPIVLNCQYDKYNNFVCNLGSVDINSLATNITNILFNLLEWYVNSAQAAGSTYADAIKPVSFKIALLSRPDSTIHTTTLYFNDHVKTTEYSVDDSNDHGDAQLITQALASALQSALSSFANLFKHARPDVYFNEVEFYGWSDYTIPDVFPNSNNVNPNPNFQSGVGKIWFLSDSYLSVLCKNGDISNCDSTAEPHKHPFSGSDEYGDPINYGYTTKVVWMRGTFKVTDIRTTDTPKKITAYLGVNRPKIENYGAGVTVELQDENGKKYYVDIYAPLPVRLCNSCTNFIGYPWFVTDVGVHTGWYTGTIINALVLGYGVPWPKGLSDTVPSEWYLIYFLPVTDVVKLRMYWFGASATKKFYLFALPPYDYIVFPAGSDVPDKVEKDKPLKIGLEILRYRYFSQWSFSTLPTGEVQINRELVIRSWQSFLKEVLEEGVKKVAYVSAGVTAGTYNPQHVPSMQSPLGHHYFLFSPLYMSITATDTNTIYGKAQIDWDYYVSAVAPFRISAEIAMTNEYTRTVLDAYSAVQPAQAFLVKTLLDWIRGPSFEDFIQKTHQGTLLPPTRAFGYSVQCGTDWCYATVSADISSFEVKPPPSRYTSGVLIKYDIRASVSAGDKCSSGTACGMVVDPYESKFSVYEFYQAFLSLEDISSIASSIDYVYINPDAMTDEAKAVLHAITESGFVGHEYKGSGGQVVLIRDAKNILADAYGGKRKGTIILGTVMLPIDTPVSWAYSNAPWLLILFAPPTTNTINKFGAHTLGYKVSSMSLSPKFQYWCYYYPNGYVLSFNLYFDRVVGDGLYPLDVPHMSVQVVPETPYICYVVMSASGSVPSTNEYLYLDYFGEYYVLPNWYWNYVVVRDEEGKVLWEGTISGIQNFKWKVVYQKQVRSTSIDNYVITVRFAQLPSADTAQEVQAFIDTINTALHNAGIEAEVTLDQIQRFIKDWSQYGLGKVIIGDNFQYSVTVETSSVRPALYYNYALEVYDKKGNRVDTLVLYSPDISELGYDPYGRVLPQEFPVFTTENVQIHVGSGGDGSYSAMAPIVFAKKVRAIGHLGITSGYVPLFYPSGGPYGLLPSLHYPDIPTGYYSTTSYEVFTLPVYKLSLSGIRILRAKGGSTLVHELYTLLRQYIEPNYEEGKGYYDSVSRAIRSYNEFLAP